MLHLMAETIAGMFWRKSRVKGRKFTVDFIMIAGVFCTCCRWQTCTVVRSRLSTRWRRKRMLMMMMTWTDSNWCRLITSSGANRSIRRRRLSEMSHTMWYFVSLLQLLLLLLLPVPTVALPDGGGGDNWTTGAISRAKLQSTNEPTSSFLQAGCPSCRPTNSVKALPYYCCMLNLQAATRTYIALWF